MFQDVEASYHHIICSALFDGKWMKMASHASHATCFYTVDICWHNRWILFSKSTKQMKSHQHVLHRTAQTGVHCQCSDVSSLRLHANQCASGTRPAGLVWGQLCTTLLGQTFSSWWWMKSCRFQPKSLKKPQLPGLYVALIVLSFINEQTTYTITTQGPLPTPILAGMNFLVSPSRVPGRSDMLFMLETRAAKKRSPGPSPSSSKSMQALLFKHLRCYDSHWSWLALSKSKQLEHCPKCSLIILQMGS